MSGVTMQEKAVRLIRAVEADGRAVSRLIVEGRRVELVLTEAEKHNADPRDREVRDAFDQIDFAKQ